MPRPPTGAPSSARSPSVRAFGSSATTWVPAATHAVRPSGATATDPVGAPASSWAATWLVATSTSATWLVPVPTTSTRAPAAAGRAASRARAVMTAWRIMSSDWFDGHGRDTSRRPRLRPRRSGYAWITSCKDCDAPAAARRAGTSSPSSSTPVTSACSAVPKWCRNGAVRVAASRPRSSSGGSAGRPGARSAHPEPRQVAAPRLALDVAEGVDSAHPRDVAPARQPRPHAEAPRRPAACRQVDGLQAARRPREPPVAEQEGAPPVRQPAPDGDADRAQAARRAPARAVVQAAPVVRGPAQAQAAARRLRPAAEARQRGEAVEAPAPRRPLQAGPRGERAGRWEPAGGAQRRAAGLRGHVGAGRRAGDRGRVGGLLSGALLALARGGSGDAQAAALVE